MSRKDCRDKSLAAAVGLPATEASSDADKTAAQSQQDVDVVTQNAYAYNTGWQNSGLLGSVENLL